MLLSVLRMEAVCSSETLVSIHQIIQGDQKVYVHLTITVKKHAKIQYFKQNTFGMWTVLYRTRSSRTQFGVSINVWRLTGDTLNITCNFLYCNHQVHREFLITLCIVTMKESAICNPREEMHCSVRSMN